MQLTCKFGDKTWEDKNPQPKQQAFHGLSGMIIMMLIIASNMESGNNVVLYFSSLFLFLSANIFVYHNIKQAFSC
ncbi:MAG TPA: hypothetical protein VNX40_16290 [Mucilaginibacter sp.]|nr:hypothetical protein [Mucilaginibacter sp.]